MSHTTIYRAMSGRIKAFTRVTWRSQSGGRTATKEGVVLGFVPAGHTILTYAHNVPESRVRISPSTYVSSVDRYAVEVASASGLPVIYGPRASTVEKQNPGAKREATR